MRTRMVIAGFVIVLLAIGYSVWQGSRNHDQIQGLISSQTGNRVSNVWTWCSAVNGDRDTMRGIAAIYHVTYTLSDLDCQRIADDTRASAR